MDFPDGPPEVGKRFGLIVVGPKQGTERLARISLARTADIIHGKVSQHCYRFTTIGGNGLVIQLQFGQAKKLQHKTLGHTCPFLLADYAIISPKFDQKTQVTRSATLPETLSKRGIRRMWLCSNQFIKGESHEHVYEHDEP
jgi:hypothetical protein